jgi:diguanylate cyclase (GGDEF)-like protein
MVLDPNGRFLDVNPAATKLLAALNPAGGVAVIGKQWQEVAGPHFTTMVTDTGQTTIHGTAGEVYDFRIVKIEAADGSCPGTVVVARDITELERLRAELTDQAVRDGLTGVYNRRQLTAVLQAQASVATDGPPLSIVMIDVDHFKTVNDRYGHAVGDQVLVDVARHLTGSVRESDMVARYGGEEFVVVLPGIDAQAAAERADRWRRQCAATAVDTPLGTLNVTFSAGVAQLRPTDGPDDLLSLADEALYRAKRAGRNQVLVAEPTLSILR